MESRRNHVVLVQGDTTYVTKEFQDPKCLENELRYLALMDGTRCPQLLRSWAGGVDLTYLDGPTLLDVFVSLEEGNRPPAPLICQLLDSLSIFYDKTAAHFGVPHHIGDINFRNFLWHSEKVYLLDFELCKEGPREEDMGRIMAFALMYHPVDTPWKRGFVAEFLAQCTRRFSLSQEDILHYYHDELSEIHRRRG